MEIDESLLLFGDDIFIGNGIFVKNPKIKDVKALSKDSKISGFKIYENYINILCLEPVDIADILWIDNNI